ncbi:rho GTPase-activating protein REN1 isoform X2 [Spinacia oleracea]|uniref:Rho GTPase-activating protein REN1 isoform X2 n=1 Tax=Spinacia oleracea TaxID=3562 RepID=A0A9R0J7K3_SPIOL|nr:rho GTPase-activating protein REN1 isoform X2 [Spinacia oleracea]
MKEQTMTSKSGEFNSQGSTQGDNAAVASPQAGPPDHQSSRSRNQVFKSGPLFISSKGIGWTSWKKRWFILTRTSLVFFRSDPSAAPQKGGEVNLTLGGIDLNNSASVEVKPEKKLLTVFFPDGRDGRAFTLKAETLEDLQEWKTALENALALAPHATHCAGQNGILKSEQVDDVNGAADQRTDGPPGKSMVIGRPILLALEDIDGSPSFLEKALRFIEDHGVRVEGVLRQAADVDEVYRRVREYEQGKNEFSPDEDAHVIGDCIKYILRELPSSPVPASCCNALLEAFRSDRNNRLNAMRTAILETFPEPNRQLLQRILLMMQTVASNKSVNRMSTSAVAACMSPLLLRPLLAGDCELGDTHMDVAGDGSFQLLQAAAAANHAQAIIITLLDEYEKIFGEGSMSDSGLFSDSDESGSGTEEASDEDMYEDDDDDSLEDDDHEDASDHDETDDDYEHSVTETCSGSGDHEESDYCDDKHSERSSSFSKSPEKVLSFLQRSFSASPRTPESRKSHLQSFDNKMKITNDTLVAKVDLTKLHRDIPAETSTIKEYGSFGPQISSKTSAVKFLESSQFRRQRWGRTSAKKNLSMESIDFSLEDEDEIQRLEDTKLELENRIEEEANGNTILQASLERRKKALNERRLALEKDVTRLQEQLQKERDLRVSLEVGSGFDMSQVHVSASINDKTKVELHKIAIAEECFSNLKQRLDDIDAELIHQHEQTASLLQGSNKVQDSSSQGTMIYNKDHEMKDHHVERSSKNEGQRNYKSEGADRDNSRKNELSSSNQNETNDVARGGSSKSTEAHIPKSSTSRRSSSKGEGSNSTSSALSKLTTRLNFLKERRTQIASELQSIDKGRGSSLTQPIISPGKGKGHEPPTPIPHNPDKNQGLDEDRVYQSSHSSCKQGSSTEVDNKKIDNNKDSNKKGSSSKSDASKSENQQQVDSNKKGSSSKSDVSQNQQQLDRVKSEGGQPSTKNLDKGRRQDGQHSSTSRTQSR